MITAPGFPRLNEPKEKGNKKQRSQVQVGSISASESPLSLYMATIRSICLLFKTASPMLICLEKSSTQVGRYLG